MSKVMQNIVQEEIKKAKLEMLIKLVREGSLDIKIAASEINMSVEEFETFLKQEAAS